MVLDKKRKYEQMDPPNHVAQLSQNSTDLAQVAQNMTHCKDNFGWAQIKLDMKKSLEIRYQN